MHIDNFPWGPLPGINSLNDAIFSSQTGNVGDDSPQPKDSLQLNIVVLNSGSPLYAGCHLGYGGQSIHGSDITKLSQTVLLPEPFPLDIVGVWMNAETRDIGARLTYDLPGLPAGDYDLPALQNDSGEFFKLPPGVSSVAVGLGTIQSGVAATAPQVGSVTGTTLISDVCGSTGPQPVRLPNNKLFPGKSARTPPGLEKFQPLLLPLRGKPPFAGTGNGRK